MKWILKAACALTAVTLLAAPLHAHSQIRVENPTAENLATASAEADALIASTGAPQLFENVSSNGMAKVRHKASGLLCTFVPGETGNRLTLFSAPETDDDVGCNTDFASGYFTYYATRYSPGYTAEDSATDAAAAIFNRFADARVYEGASARVQPPAEVTGTGFVALLIGPTDQPRYTHALTAQIGDWIFKQRMTGDGDADAIMANQIVGGAFFDAVLQAAVNGSSANP